MINAKKPVFYTGGGVINSGPEASNLLRQLVRMTGFPITSTLMGLGAIRHQTSSGWACWACTAPMKPTWRCTIVT
jgi:thiamine pyrophosphate-dependent acetolactate synthase large subunit-like protein